MQQFLSTVMRVMRTLMQQFLGPTFRAVICSLSLSTSIMDSICYLLSLSHTASVCMCAGGDSIARISSSF